MASQLLPDGYTISADPDRLDLDVIHGFISGSYWAKAIPKALIERMVRHSLCFGVYHHEAQVGFARVISDYTTFGYLADVFILPLHRGRGLSKVLVATVMAHPELQGLRRWMLVTADAQQLYVPFGFKPVTQPERYMEIHRPGIYENPFQE